MWENTKFPGFSLDGDYVYKDGKRFLRLEGRHETTKRKMTKRFTSWEAAKKDQWRLKK